MLISDQIIQQEDAIIKIGPMECLASCLLTFLKMSNKDHRLFLLDYWNIRYTHKLLLSGKTPNHYNLKQFYGLELIKISNESIQSLIEVLQDEKIVLHACTASRLPYFPKKMLTHESSDNSHCVILYGFNEIRNTFLLLDPIVGFKGELSYEELFTTGYGNNLLQNVVLQLPSSELFKSPNYKDAFAISASRNLNFYLNSESDMGVFAFDLFIHDIKDSLHWTVDELEIWVQRNNITIISIIRTRSLVWESYHDLQLMDSKIDKEGAQNVESIINNWSSINFLLHRYAYKKKQNNADPEIIDPIVEKCLAVRTLEISFLKFMDGIGRSLT